MEKKKCKYCGKIKSIKLFYTQGKYIRSYCKKCGIKKSGEWAKKNINKNREKALRHYYKNKLTCPSSS